MPPTLPVPLYANTVSYYLLTTKGFISTLYLRTLSYGFFYLTLLDLTDFLSANTVLG